MIYKPKILLVPAWYPASFFTEQMKLVEDSFNFKILKGNRNVYGKKKWLKKKLKGKSKSFISKTQADFLEIEFDYINNLPPFFFKKQEKYLDDCFNRIIHILFDGSKPDLIHIQSLSDTAYYVNRWAKANNVPVILTEHVLFVRHQTDSFQRLKEKVYESVDHVLLVSNYLYRNLLTNGINPGNVEIIGNLVRDEYISLPLKQNKLNKELRILFVAAHLFDKDIDVLFEALEILLNKGFSAFHVDIIGLEPAKIYLDDESNECNLQEVINQKGLSSTISLLGEMDRKEMLNAYQDYSFLVSTSKSETFGLAVAEAIANGLPVVCTDSGGIRDFVDESNGIVVPVRNPKALATAIVRMFDNISNYNGEQISTEIRKRFGVKAFTESIRSEYRNAIYDKSW